MTDTAIRDNVRKAYGPGVDDSDLASPESIAAFLIQSEITDWTRGETMTHPDLGVTYPSSWIKELLPFVIAASEKERWDAIWDIAGARMLGGEVAFITSTGEDLFPTVESIPTLTEAGRSALTGPSALDHFSKCALEALEKARAFIDHILDEESGFLD